MKTDSDDKKKEIMDRDCEDFIEYQIEINKYVDRKNKLDDDIQQIFNIVYGQYIPGMQQKLESDSEFKKIKDNADSVELLKIIERISYNYQPHEYTPLGAWDDLDKLGRTRQSDEMNESEQFEKFKTVIKVYKVSGIDFPLLCTHTVDISMRTLREEGVNACKGTYKGNTSGKESYLNLNDVTKALVNERAEDICIVTRLLSLASNKKLVASKQELKNDLVKGKDNYPQTITNMLNFLEKHYLATQKVTSHVQKNQDRIHNQWISEAKN